MADEETQGTVDTSWWGFDDFDDSSSSSAGFDEPLVWPESLPWDDGGSAGAGPLPDPPDLDDPDRDLIFPVAAGEAAVAGPDADAEARLDEQWQATGNQPEPEPEPQAEPQPEPDPDATMQHAGPLSGLGGGAAAPAAGASRGQRIPESIWSNELRREPDDPVGLGSLPFPAVYADAEGTAARPRWRRFDIRPGNAAVVALISVVSLVLLGMFLSVRARNDDVPTETSRTGQSDEIAVTGPLNTIPATTSLTTTAPAPAINIQDLLPPAEGTGTTVASNTGAGSGGTRTAATSATTAPAARNAAPAASTATTSPPASEPTATTTATTVPTTTETTAPTSANTPPIDDTTNTTAKRTTTSITFPPFELPPGYTMPSLPPGVTFPNP